jgi:hypothetical protein
VRGVEERVDEAARGDGGGRAGRGGRRRGRSQSGGGRAAAILQKQKDSPYPLTDFSCTLINYFKNFKRNYLNNYNKVSNQTFCIFNYMYE